MNNSVYEQIFRTQSVWDDVLYLELRTLLCFDNEDSAVIDDIVSLGKNMGLEVNSEDVEELLEDHKDELSTEELE